MRDTPSSVMYSDLRLFGGLPNRDVARRLLRDDTSVGGQAPALRVSDKTFLSREIVHARPGSVPPELFCDFSASVPPIGRALIARHGTTSVIEHYRDEAAGRMGDALAGCSVDPTPYLNAVRQIASTQPESPRDCAVLLCMHFVATGCLGDPVRAAELVRDHVSSRLVASLSTLASTDAPALGDPGDARAGSCPALGLLRIVDGMAKPPIHRLSPDPGGTVVGYLPTGPSTIADVEADVSRCHLRIRFDGSSWWAEGMGSTNGTTLVRGEDRSVVTVEPPRRAREAGERGRAVELHNSDVLCLGSATRFLVMRLAE